MIILPNFLRRISRRDVMNDDRHRTRREGTGTRNHRRPEVGGGHTTLWSDDKLRLTYPRGIPGYHLEGRTCGVSPLKGHAHLHNRIANTSVDYLGK